MHSTPSEFRVGDQVNYYQCASGGWVPAVIVQVHWEPACPGDPYYTIRVAPGGAEKQTVGDRLAKMSI